MYTPSRFSVPRTPHALIALVLAAMGLPVLATAHDVTLGDSSTTDVNVTSDQNWTTLRSVVVTIQSNDAATHSCMAVGSADFYQPVGSPDIENRYRFVIARNDSNPTTNLGSERLVSLIDNSTTNDPDSKPISTNRVFPNLTSTNGRNGTGEHTFYLLGRKFNSTALTSTVEDATLSVVCVDP